MSERLITEGPRLLRPEDGLLVGWFGSLMSIKLSGEDTGGSHSLIDVLEPSGTASPVHIHNSEDEMLYVLEGEYTVRCGDLEAVAGPGTIVRMPRGIPHSTQVTGDGTARALMLFAPGGFERFFIEAGTSTDRRELPPPSLPDPARLAAIGKKYDVDIVGPPPGH